MTQFPLEGLSVQQMFDTVTVHPELTQTLTQTAVATEVPVALIYNGISHVVMMATPKDLDSFAYGFSLSEGIIDHPHQIYDLSIVHQPLGIEIHMEIATRHFVALKERRRQLAGRTGCGLCGTEQLSQIQKPMTALPEQDRITLAHFQNARDCLRRVQPVGAETHCTHAAVWLTTEGAWIAGFEDIGRHVALDKLLGYRAQQSDQRGVIVVSSRASYEMVQKMAVCGAEILIACSAATSLAIELAQKAHLTLATLHKDHRFTIYSAEQRCV